MQRTELEKAFVDAALTLAGESRAAAVCASIPNTTPPLYVAMGSADDIEKLVRMSAGRPKAVDPRNLFFSDALLADLRYTASNEEMRGLLDDYIEQWLKEKGH